MLNPCRIKAWFIIELCDTIEASQIELANYELYSSSPKEFSVFWSNIYPTQTWNHLGTFEARNQRSMQTFPLTLRNLGKFIKVIIFSHHGKEHYCPLSVFRVIGYSMVYEYDEIEEENEHGDLNKRTKTNGTDHVKSKEDSQNSITKNSNNTETNVTKEKIWKEETSQLTKLCYIRRKYCSYSQFEDTSLNQPACLFYRKIILRKEHICDNIWASEMPEPSFISTNENKLNSSIHSKNLNSTSNRLIVDETMKKSKEFTSFFNISSFYKKLFEQSGNSFDKHKMNRTSEDSHSSNIKSSQISMDSSNYTSLNNYNTSKNNPRAKIDDKLPKKEEHFISQNNNNVHDSTKRSCNCPEVVKNAEVTLPKQNTNWTETLLSDPSKQGSVDSATLIQKESVLVKLNMRLKESEANLNLINRYLQQLSESYRKQVEDMLSMFYGAVKAVRATSDKADMIVSELFNKFNCNVKIKQV
ncbi:SUN domain-containing ossification factor [Caerostris extrusa]|uniref:SUN domain-containing ossification factor n=1 Tax=Caerostris extrusa TaxID=172846 RepID=A0AAV4TPC0_CAEEX|nr:SUN domain-containing ossification factor [Caerostris extrusa]